MTSASYKQRNGCRCTHALKNPHKAKNTVDKLEEMANTKE